MKQKIKSRNNPYTYDQMMAKLQRLHSGKYTLQQMVMRKLDIHVQMDKDKYIIYITSKYELKIIKDLNIRPKTMKFLKEKSFMILEWAIVSSIKHQMHR